MTIVIMFLILIAWTVWPVVPFLTLMLAFAPLLFTMWMISIFTKALFPRPRFKLYFIERG